uniref:Uncharacterized protein n=1 Tax=Oryza punctata TaxID=4537 RepID=A0A0E0MJ33_ORYPU
MEAAVATPSLLFSSPTPRPSSCLPPPPLCSSSSYASHGLKLLQPQLLFVSRLSRNCNRSDRSIHLSLRCSSSITDSASSSTSSERWVLEPAGDGDWRHIGYRVARPGGFQIATDAAVTVGRVPEQADIVLSVTTGDIHLAMFRVSKMVVDVPSDANEADEQEAETAQVSAATQKPN